MKQTHEGYTAERQRGEKVRNLSTEQKKKKKKKKQKKKRGTTECALQ